jgi:hypothetical protein
VSRLQSIFPSPAAYALLVAFATWGTPSRAWAQACCAGASAVTPARLAMHEDALVGVQLRAANVFGSYDLGGHYHSSPGGTSEYDFEEDLLGAVHVTRRGQLALLVPFVETRRQTPQDGAHLGGGVGDVNAGGRYDFVLAGESAYVPGIALLAGVTLPTGTPVESASKPLAVDATGIGAFQVNAALALEQAFGPWLVNATGLVAKRTARFGETLGTQFTLLGAVAYVFPRGEAAGISVSYTFEGDATTDQGASVAASGKRVTLVSLLGLVPLSDTWRVQGSVFVNPPLYAVGSNQLATGGVTFAVIRSWM